MKLVTFASAAVPRIGAVDTKRKLIVDLQAAHAALRGHETPAFSDMLALIDSGGDSLRVADELCAQVMGGDVSAAQVPYRTSDLLAPVPVPRQMRDCLAFELHYSQARRQALRVRAASYPDPVAAEIALRDSDEFKIPAVWYEQPVYYKGNRFSVIGPEQDILWPSYSTFVDYELEYGIVIGRKGKNIPRSQARDHIFGYCIFNDMSAHDAQYKEYPARLGPAKGKDFDTGNVLGPWLTTANEIPSPYALTMVARINGEEWSRGYSGDIHHSFEAMIEHISRDETLHPGEFIGSGTVGNGCGLELGRRLKPDDVIELEVDGLGCLRNRVISQHSA
jgi:2-keto-4-pentenoate hydratase/2-oxohepta-3-ene-1,7-dioic acid hydratase in catechol pathway